MYNFDYMWLDEDLDYDTDIDDEGVYEDWEIQENQQLLIIELSQLQGETLTPFQDNDNSINVHSGSHQDEPSRGLSKEKNSTTNSYDERELLDNRLSWWTKEYQDGLKGVASREAIKPIDGE